jgi:hypothetical protein
MHGHIKSLIPALLVYVPIILLYHIQYPLQFLYFLHIPTLIFQRLFIHFLLQMSNFLHHSILHSEAKVILDVQKALGAIRHEVICDF